MALKSGFFNSVDDDRAKNADFFSRYFASFIGNGIFPNPSDNFQVIANDDMTIVVTKGSAWINGTFCFDDYNYITTLDVADGVLDRIDRVVLRLDVIDREIKVLIKKGTFASSPVAPALQRDADAYELALADIAVNRGIISITQANITDLRLNKELCGIVHGVVDQVDTTAVFNQFESWYAQTKANYDADIATWTQEKKDDFDTWYTTNVNEFESRFNTWFNSNTTNWGNEFTEWFDEIRGQLEGDIAANLTAEILELQKTKADKTELATVKEELSTHLVDYKYQRPIIIGTQIQIKQESNSNRLYFKLDNDLTGNITISLDGGLTEKPLCDFEGVQLTELEKGFVEVVADATFFTLRSRSGLSKSDRLALIDIVNVAEENETFIKTDIVNKINEVDSGDGFEPLVPTSPWIDIQSAIPLISTGKKWASGIAKRDIDVDGLDFTPKVVVIKGIHQSSDSYSYGVFLDKTLMATPSGINMQFGSSISYNPFTVRENGFSIRMINPSDFAWIAIE